MLHPALAETLDKTYGCVVFQEQVNEVVRIMTGCTDAEADRFRKSITQHTKMGTMQNLKEQFITRACAYRSDFHPPGRTTLGADSGLGRLWITEGHAASFALTGYRSAYLSVHYAAEFFAGLMNHQPMGFFNANTLAAEARRRGVQTLPVDINASADKCASDSNWSDGVRSIERWNPILQHSSTSTTPLQFGSGSGRSQSCVRRILRRSNPHVKPGLLSRSWTSARGVMHRDRLENLILPVHSTPCTSTVAGCSGVWTTLGTALSYVIRA